MSADETRLRLIIQGDSRLAQQALQNLGRNLQNVQPVVQNLNQRMRSLGATVGATFKVMLSAAAIRAAVSGLQGVMSAAAGSAYEIERLSRMTGLSTEKASELRAGAKLLEVEFGTLQGAITSMLGNMKSLNAADNPFRILGIQVVNAKGQMRDFDAILSDTLDKLQKMGPTGAREMFASKIFGGATPELLRMLDDGSEGLKKAAESARAMGLVLSPQQIQAAIQYRTAVRQLGQAWEGVKMSIGNSVMPTLTRFFGNLSQWMQTGLPRLKETLAPVISYLSSLWSVIVNLVGVLNAGYRAFLDWLGAGQRLQFMGKGIGEVWRRVGATLKDFGEWLSRLKQRIQDGDVAGAMNELWQDLKQSAINGAQVAENFFDETLPAWGRAFGNLMKKLGDKFMLDETTGKTFSFGEKLGELFYTALNGVVVSIAESLPGLVSAFDGLLTQLITGIAGFLFGFGEKMVEKILEGFGFKKEHWDGIKTSLSEWLTNTESSLEADGKRIKDMVAKEWDWEATVWDNIKVSLDAWVANQKDGLKQSGSDVRDAISGAWVFSPDAWESIWTSLKTWTAEKWNSFVSLGSSIGEAIGTAIRNAVNSVINWANGVIQSWNQRMPSFLDLPELQNVGTPPAGGGQSSGSGDDDSDRGDAPGGSFTGPPYLGPAPDDGSGSNSGAGDMPGGGGAGGRTFRLADGGVFRARPGGRDVRAKVAEAGKDEAFLPLDPAVFRRLGLGGGGPMTIHNHIYLDGREIAQYVKEMLMSDVKMQKQLAF